MKICVWYVFSFQFEIEISKYAVCVCVCVSDKREIGDDVNKIMRSHKT